MLSASLSCLFLARCIHRSYGVQIYRLLHNPETSSSLPIQSFAELLPSFTLPTDSSKVLLLFFRQSLLKQLLTEGERYILSFSSISMHDQGVFDIVNNLGSLFARFLFQPLEEGFYLYFSRVFFCFCPSSIGGKSSGNQKPNHSTRLSPPSPVPILRSYPFLPFDLVWMHRYRLRLSLCFRASLPLRRISARYLDRSDSASRLLRLRSISWTKRHFGSLFHGTFPFFRLFLKGHSRNFAPRALQLRHDPLLDRVCARCPHWHSVPWLGWIHRGEYRQYGVSLCAPLQLLVSLCGEARDARHCGSATVAPL